MENNTLLNKQSWNNLDEVKKFKRENNPDLEANREETHTEKSKKSQQHNDKDYIITTLYETKNKKKKTKQKHSKLQKFTETRNASNFENRNKETCGDKNETPTVNDALENNGLSTENNEMSLENNEMSIENNETTIGNDTYQINQPKSRKHNSLRITENIPIRGDEKVNSSSSNGNSSATNNTSLVTNVGSMSNLHTPVNNAVLVEGITTLSNSQSRMSKEIDFNNVMKSTPLDETPKEFKTGKNGNIEDQCDRIKHFYCQQFGKSPENIQVYFKNKLHQSSSERIFRIYEKKCDKRSNSINGMNRTFEGSTSKFNGNISKDPMKLNITEPLHNRNALIQEMVNSPNNANASISHNVSGKETMVTSNTQNKSCNDKTEIYHDGNNGLGGSPKIGEDGSNTSVIDENTDCTLRLAEVENSMDRSSDDSDNRDINSSIISILSDSSYIKSLSSYVSLSTEAINASHVQNEGNLKTGTEEAFAESSQSSSSGISGSSYSTDVGLVSGSVSMRESQIVPELNARSECGGNDHESSSGQIPNQDAAKVQRNSTPRKSSRKTMLKMSSVGVLLEQLKNKYSSEEPMECEVENKKTAIEQSAGSESENKPEGDKIVCIPLEPLDFVTKRKRRRTRTRKSKNICAITPQTEFIKKEAPIIKPLNTRAKPSIHIRFDEIDMKEEGSTANNESGKPVEKNNSTEKLPTAEEDPDIELNLKASDQLKDVDTRPSYFDEQAVLDRCRRKNLEAKFALDESPQKLPDKILESNAPLRFTECLNMLGTSTIEGQKSPKLDICDVAGRFSISEKVIQSCPKMINVKPCVGDIIAFKVLKMSENYTPELSNFVVGKVLSRNEKTETILVTFKILDGIAEVSDPKGKFCLEEDVEDTSEKTFLWKDLLEPRLVYP